MNFGYGASTVFYIILSLIILMFAVAAEKTKQSFFPISIVIVLTLVAGFRAYDVGTDTAEYVRIFGIIENGGTFAKEPGFSLISKILLAIDSNPTFLLLAYAALT